MTPNSPDPEIGPEARFRPQLLLQWFVFPMLVVTLCVGIYLSFRFLTAENKTSADYLNDLNSGNPHRAWQAAFSLANEVNLGRLPDTEKPVVCRRLLEMLELSSPGAGQIRQYFILILGRLRYSEAIPKLLELAGGTDASEKIYAFLALREIQTFDALNVAYQALQDEDPAVRKTAAHFFSGLIGQEPRSAQVFTDITAHLHPLLNDPVADVRWNAALSLAAFNDTTAIPVLAGMLDRQALSAELKKFGGLDEMNAEKIINAALAASARFGDPRLEEQKKKLATREK